MPVARQHSVSRGEAQGSRLRRLVRRFRTVFDCTVVASDVVITGVMVSLRDSGGLPVVEKPARLDCNGVARLRSRVGTGVHVPTDEQGDVLESDSKWKDGCT